ncbi:MAG: histidine ammonia-lyase [Actinobacteria bacterium 13_2_20CM_2_66_6]|nr:MAG: histidine ammonia-lyase [Actinobacteria bacterium 13_2_20CM_2_66_6]
MHGVAKDGARALARCAPETVALAAAARQKMERSRVRVENAARSRDPVYGVSTGFGALAGTRIAPLRQPELQLALIRSHAAGVGPPVDGEVVRATMLLRARTLAMGMSGVRPLLAEALIAMLNARITPVVPRYGSVGCSGDLAPLAHIGLALVGEGEVVDAEGARRTAAQALKAARLKPVKLETKEGLALINGTDGMLGMLALACADAELLFRTADITAAMSAEALLGTDRAFQSRLHDLRPHAGQVASAANLEKLMRGSQIVSSHRHSQHAVQDSYSVRCSPQVAGAARDTLDFARRIAEVELSSTIDNPIVLESGEVESNGNFHGEPLAFAADFLAIAAAEVGSIAERRVDRLLDPHRSQGLPPFLAEEPGVNSGLMVAQYTAAALVAENRRLAAPASVDSVPTSGMQEDHVSMGWGAALKLRAVLDNLSHILAVELCAAARAQELRRPLEPSPATGAVRDVLRKKVGGVGPDRVVAPELAAAEALIRSAAIVEAAQSAAGPLR